MFSIILPTGLIDLLVVDAAVKKHRFPKDGKNATSPVLNSVRALSIPTVIGNFTCMIFSPSRVTSPSNGSARTSAPTVSGARWRLKIPLKVLDPTDTVNFVCSILPGIDAQKQAIKYGVKFSGCTVHFVDSGVDTGPIILQSVVSIDEGDTVKTLSDKILRKEHKLYPQAVELLASRKIRIYNNIVLKNNGVY